MPPFVPPSSVRSRPWPRRITPVMPWLAAALWITACRPLVRPAPFEGARDRVTDVSLRGPFDGQVVDETTGVPIQGATVVGAWSYDQGDGLIGPSGSETTVIKTDQAGRYRIPKAPMHKRGRHLRLVSFQLIVYKRGYVGYRSDQHFDGTARTDFTLRHNQVDLRKWRDTDSHAEHLVFLAAPVEIMTLARWEREAANLDLYRTLGGAAAIEVSDEPSAVESANLRLLDATGLLPPEQVRRRTGYTEVFEVRELGDLVRTHFYHGVHLQAQNREEVWDVAYRVWKDPPGGLAPVVETFEATLPQVSVTGEVTDETWIYDADDVRAVAFLDRERNVGVLLTCGAMQCADIETAIILSGLIHENLDLLRFEEAPAAVDSATPSPSSPEAP